MAKTNLPDALARRHLLEGSLDAGKAKALGDAYLAEGREIEAIDFFAKANDQAALGALRDEGLRQGDTFLVRLVYRVLDEDASASDWQRLADAATHAGRERDAETAQRLASVGG